jgi:hypothetical protein
MNHMGLEQKLSLFALRVGTNAFKLAEDQAVPWASRDPATQACAIIYGTLLIDKVRGAECPVFVVSECVSWCVVIVVAWCMRCVCHA